jgi:hypothetical protein
MPASRSADTVLDREFLRIRCRLIELAAIFDRIDRAEGVTADNPQWPQIRRSLEILLRDAPGRTEQVQMAFSLPYEENWRSRGEGRGARGEGSSPQSNSG